MSERNERPVLARQPAIPPALGAIVPCGSAFQRVEFDCSLSLSPQAGRGEARGSTFHYSIVHASGSRPPRGRSHAHADMPATTGGETFEQAFQHLGNSRMIVRDVIHQLPALLPD